MSEKPTYKQLEAKIVQLELALAEFRGTHQKASIGSKRDFRLNAEHFRLVFHTSPDAININRLSDGAYIDINEGFERISGYSREELLDNPSLHIDIWKDPKDRERLEEGLSAAGYVENFEAQFVAKDGSTKHGLLSARVAKLGDEVVLLSITRDISELKAMEKEKEKIRRQLIMAQRLEAIGTLAGGVAHDFNNLLMGIQGRASMISYDLDPSHPCHEHVGAILEYSRSAADLTKQLLGIARGGKYDVKPIDLNMVLSESAAIFGRTKKEIQIHSKLHDPPPVVAADHRQIEQVLLNLYVNAWQAMPDGGRLYLQTSILNLDADFCETFDARPGQYAKISVTDTGVGMDQATLLQIFDPFFTSKEKSHGTGLGLSSAYGIVKNHGGVITVYSEPGHGTTFNIYLPLTDLPVAEERPDKAGFEMGAETILLVDDEDMVLEVARAMLGRLGYRVVAAKGGEVAIHLLKNSESIPDLVILDLIMPNMNGEKTFDAIREIAPSLPVILASGYTMDGHASKVMEKGCNGFIQKPFNLEELSQKIRQVINARNTSNGQ